MSEFTGTWHINEMDQWDEDYINMEVQAHITIDKNDGGNFQFGLVCGQIDGEIIKDKSGEILEFTWDGNDESDEAQGSGWIKLKTKDELEGKIKLHQGDSSLFTATRA